MAKRKNLRGESKLQEKVKRILQNMCGSENVRDVKGIGEYGVDLLFKTPDAFGQLRTYGIQFKNKGITGSKGKATENVKTIIGQLVLALEKEMEEGDKYSKLSGVYLVTSGEVNEHAHKCIRIAFNGHRMIYIVDGRGLNKFIKEQSSRLNTFKES